MVEEEQTVSGMRFGAFDHAEAAVEVLTAGEKGYGLVAVEPMQGVQEGQCGDGTVREAGIRLAP